MENNMLLYLKSKIYPIEIQTIHVSVHTDKSLVTDKDGHVHIIKLTDIKRIENADDTIQETTATTESLQPSGDLISKRNTV